MRIHWFQHVPFEDLGCIEDWILANHHVCSSTPFFAGAEPPSASDFDFLIVMGGPMGIHDENELPWLRAEKKLIRETIAEVKPILGICLGAQLIADCLGAEVFPNDNKEIGFWPVTWTPEAQESAFPAPPSSEVTVFQWHGDTFTIPAKAIPLASSRLFKNQGFVYEGRVVGLQFHLESTPHSVEQLLTNCSHELESRTGIQTASEIRAGLPNLPDTNTFMKRILEDLAERA